MIIALAVPAYKQQVHVQTACTLAQDAMSAVEMGWRPMLLWADMTGIERARNMIVKQAEQAGARLLLMVDSDTMPVSPHGGLKHMWQAMTDTSAAVVGAAVPIRNGDRMNCEPARPGEVYPGVCGSAYLLIDLVKLRDLPRPWFRCELTDDGIDKAVGSDIWFCRHVQAHGHAVTVNFALPMAHAELVATATRF
jgi:hypothetical protein